LGALKRLEAKNCAVVRDLVAERDAELESLRTSLAVLQPARSWPAAAVTVTGDPVGGKPVNGNSHAM
jgi:hypothetical protein